MKNGGSHFLAEIASKEFMDNLVSLLRIYGDIQQPHEAVRNKILELIQMWAIATERRSEFSYIGDTYKILQRDHYRFPPRVEMSSSMLDSSAVSVTRQQILETNADRNDSLLNGSTQMFVCVAAPPSLSPIVSITVETVETYLTTSAPPNQSPCRIWELFNL